MALALPLFVNGTIISAVDINARVVSIEDFVNEGIAQADLDAAAWVTTRHIYRPEFYGAPDPRCHAVSGDCRWRVTDDSIANSEPFHPEARVGRFVPVRGLAARIQIDSTASASVTGTVRATFHAFEFEGAGGAEEATEAAQFRLYLDGSQIGGSGVRRIYTAGIVSPAGRQHKHHSLLWDFNLGELAVGVHNLSVRAQLSTANQANVFRVQVEARSFVVDLHYK